MLFKIQNVLLVLVCLVLVGCGPILSPGIHYKNVSRNGDVIKAIKINWNGSRLLGELYDLNFCGESSENFVVKSRSDFFGPVQIEWEDAKGKKHTKDFTFTKSYFPTLKRFPTMTISGKGKHVYMYVKLYFTQDDVYLYTSDTPNLKEIESNLYKEAGITCNEFRDRKFREKYGESMYDEPKPKTKSKKSNNSPN